MGRFRCTLVVDMDMPMKKTEEAEALFAGVAGTAIAASRIFPLESIKIVECKAEEIKQEKPNA